MTLCLPTETLPFAAGDPDWVADLLDTAQTGDLEAVAAKLDEVVLLMRKAAKARLMLPSVGQNLLQAGIAARARRSTS